MSSWGRTGPGGCGKTVLRLAAIGAAVLALFVVLVVASCAMAPRETNPTDTTVNECGELSTPCEGQTP